MQDQAVPHAFLDDDYCAAFVLAAGQVYITYVCGSGRGWGVGEGTVKYMNLLAPGVVGSSPYLPHQMLPHKALGA
jgi:hypothetical protein